MELGNGESGGVFGAPQIGGGEVGEGGVKG